MKVQLESTTKIIDLVTVDGAVVPARCWEGVTENGVPCIAFITRIAVKDGEDSAEFERDLEEQRQPSAELQSFPLRMTL